VSDLPGNHARQEDTDADTDGDETVEADQNDHGYDHWRFAQHTQQLMLRHFTTHYQLAVISVTRNNCDSRAGKCDATPSA